MIFTERMTRALDTAALLHKDHIRIGKEKIPYITHLIHVLAIVDRHGGDENALIAALLHDTVEEVEDYTVEDIRKSFGDDVARLVESLTETRIFSPEMPPRERWVTAKKSYLEKLTIASTDAKIISAADKIHNMSSIISGYESGDQKLMLRFDDQALKGQLWFLGEVYGLLEDSIPKDMSIEYKNLFEKLEKLSTK